MTDDSTTPPEGRSIRDVTIGPDGVTRRGTFQSPSTGDQDGHDKSGLRSDPHDEDQLTGPVETVHPPRSAGSHTGVTEPVGPATPPPVSSSAHANAAAEEPSSDAAGGGAVLGDARSARAADDTVGPTTGEETRAHEAAASTAAPAATAAEPAPPLAEAEKQAPAGTVPVAVAGATGEVPRTIYVEAPTPPKKKGNRGVGILISLLASLVFTIVWAGVSAAILAIAVPASEFAASYSGFIANPAWWVPVITFFIGLVIIVSILNRAGWAWYIIGGLLVGLLAYAGYVGGALISTAGQLSPAEVQGFLIRTGLNPLAIAVGITAREVSIWTGAAIAARGRRVKARNLEARAQFDRESAERRAEYERVRAGFAA